MSCGADDGAVDEPHRLREPLGQALEHGDPDPTLDPAIKGVLGGPVGSPLGQIPLGRAGPEDSEDRVQDPPATHPHSTASLRRKKRQDQRPFRIRKIEPRRPNLPIVPARLNHIDNGCVQSLGLRVTSSSLPVSSPMKSAKPSKTTQEQATPAHRMACNREKARDSCTKLSLLQENDGPSTPIRSSGQGTRLPGGSLNPGNGRRRPSALRGLICHGGRRRFMTDRMRISPAETRIHFCASSKRISTRSPPAPALRGSAFRGNGLSPTAMRLQSRAVSALP